MSSVGATATTRPPPSRNEMALERTQLAHERTLMAWIRTSVSLISFGFSIYKFFDLSTAKVAAKGMMGPRPFAMLMIGTGIIALAIAVARYWREGRLLNRAAATHDSMASVIAGLVAVLGLLAMAAVIFQE